MGDQDTLKVGHNLYLNAKNVPIPETLKKTVRNNISRFKKIILDRNLP